MKNWMLFLFVLLMALVFTVDAEARGGRRGGGGGGSAHAWPTGTNYGGMQVAIEEDLQAVAQKRADAMAAHGNYDHNIHSYTSAPHWNAKAGLAGEGTGMGPSHETCPTCIMGNTVVADACTKCRAGGVVRVRIFRNR